MAKVTVHRWSNINSAIDDNYSSRMGTEEGIARVHGNVVPHSAFEVDESEVDSTTGMTKIGFLPKLDGDDD